MRVLLPCAVVLLWAAPSPAQPATRTLAKPEAEFADPFSQVGGVRELRDGRVMVADTRDKQVQLVDLRRGAAVKVGREGSGPGEYGMPLRLFPAANDTTLVFDPLNSRYLVIGPDGKPVSTFRIGDDPAPAAPERGQIPRLSGMAMGMPRVADARGRIYFEGAGIAMGPNGPVTADSAPISRYDRATRRIDTVAWIALPKNNAQVSASGNGGRREMNVRIGSRVPFAARDAWTVLPNGHVVVARVRDYHVDVYGPGGLLARGPVVAYSPIRVGNAEKEEYRQLMKSGGGGIAITRTSEQGGAGPARNAQSAGPTPFEEPAEWPTVKPAFSEIHATPTGETWVLRHRRAGDDVPVYDVFSPAGRHTARVVLPRRTRVVGFGNGAVYTVRSDDDDLQYLQRFRT